MRKKIPEIMMEPVMGSTLYLPVREINFPAKMELGNIPRERGIRATPDLVGEKPKTTCKKIVM